MSDNQEKYQEIDTKVALSVEDCQNIRNYGEHFKISLPKGLQKALLAFEKEQTFDHQNQIKLHICKWMVTSQHESYQDPIWDEPKVHANEIIYDITFDEQVEEMLNETPEPESPEPESPEQESEKK